ncbi:alpha-D-ribose 1-methylphosphonate 5-triphosphate diphosphatase (plasmid) [Rhodobacteraceae bacterium SC52]|nr:alpha-D-ribose 1-methylphosphonate 5-triphosphate diphosphatase [Rhodobacteraceae bacterium SC52]
MTPDIILANAKLVLPDETFVGQVVLRGGLIQAIEPGHAIPKGAVDCGGDFLAPGLVELHTDNLERHISPRPKVNWPHKAAIMAHDAELASVGITTVFDAVRVGSITSNSQTGYRKYARALASEILAIRETGVLKISHHLHLRAEICSETLAAELDEFGPEDRIGIVSLMDHTPGQRQFRDEQKFADYLQGKQSLSDAETRVYLDDLKELQARVGTLHEKAAIAAAQRFGATLASHDDTTAEQVAVSQAYGIRLAEFPTTREAAIACKDAGISVIMGAPNLVRGGSHSGNVAAMELAQDGLLDMLSSDYIPASLLMAAVQLGEIWGNMARGLATVSHAPAQGVGLLDRGCLKEGLKADVIRFGIEDSVPVLRGVWAHGRQVA